MSRPAWRAPKPSTAKFGAWSRLSRLKRDVLATGMRWIVPPDVDPALQAKLLEARRHFRASLAGEAWAEAIEFFDAGRYIENATLARIFFTAALSTIRFSSTAWPRIRR